MPDHLYRTLINLRVLVVCADGAGGGGVQYCQWETFNASCASRPDHVILMTSARYGRMRFGRCMREDHGSVGCSADVMAHLDRRCSGRRTCRLDIPDATLHANHPCPKELMPYLEADYSCVRRKLDRLAVDPSDVTLQAKLVVISGTLSPASLLASSGKVRCSAVD